VLWFRGYDASTSMREISREEALTLPRAGRGHPRLRVLPPESCGRRCSFHGHCVQHIPRGSDSVPPGPVCSCFFGYLVRSQHGGARFLLAAVAPAPCAFLEWFWSHFVIPVVAVAGAFFGVEARCQRRDWAMRHVVV
jgi:hypothetical protein